MTHEETLERANENAQLREARIEGDRFVSKAERGDPIPPLIRAGLIHYRDERIPPGGFLRAVLENNLAGAISRADPNSLAALKEIVQWCWWDLPATSWGSPEKVSRWLEG